MGIIGITTMIVSDVDALDVYCSYLDSALNEHSIFARNDVGHVWHEQDKYCFTNEIAIEPFEYGTQKMIVGIEYHCVMNSDIGNKFTMTDSEDIFGYKDVKINQIHKNGTCVGLMPKGVFKTDLQSNESVSEANKP